ncbi:MAG: hypothetical protein U9N85_06450 [Bacteroidota bacterium]|nr:hypothetical protein [Bacteroidota bacterium]
MSKILIFNGNPKLNNSLLWNKAQKYTILGRLRTVTRKKESSG